MPKIAVLTMILAASSLAGCGTLRSERALESVWAGMSKADIIKKIGHPAAIRGTFKNSENCIVEVWEYRIGRAKDFERVLGEAAFTGLTIGAGAQALLTSADTERRWIYFIEDRFVGWTPAGDWARDNDVMREMKFNTRY